MSYPALVLLAACGLAAVALWIFLPFVVAELRESQRPRIPHWCGAIGLTELLFALTALGARPAANEAITHAILLSAAAFGGILLKWLLDILARRPRRLHEQTVVRTLLLTPLLPLAAPALFGHGAATPSLIVLWFGTGFFCHTIIGDLERMHERERVIVRRREPPLPVRDAPTPDFRPSHPASSR